MKAVLMKELILRLPDFTKEFIWTTDACKDGLGAVLTQKDNLGEFVISYTSRTTNINEKNYASHNLEGCAVIFALKI